MLQRRVTKGETKNAPYEGNKEEVDLVRQIKRNIAREAMKKSGYKQINKKRASLGGRSLFAVNWRDALAFALTHPPRMPPGMA